MGFTLRDYQEDGIQACVDILQSKKRTCKEIVVGPTGCHAKGKELLKYNGDFIKVEDVREGTLLMGPDSSPRKVLSLVTGEELFYTITLRNGISFSVNENHILQLYRTGSTLKKYYDKTYPKEVVISVKEYITWAKSRKHLYKIKRADFIDFGIRLKLKLDPYFLGLWLGDGTSKQVHITTEDKEVKQYLKSFCSINSLIYKEVNYSKTKAVTIQLQYKQGVKSNVKKQLESLNLVGNKHIPKFFKTGTKEDRFSLLSGIIDSDGSYDVKKGRYEITQKNKKLSLDIYFLCNSLGLNPTIKIKKVSCTNCSNEISADYYRISFRQSEYLKCLIKRKKPVQKTFTTKKDMYSFSVVKNKIEKFYGFKIDKDNLYLDDDFVIHHNCGKSIYVAETVKRVDAPIVVLQPSKELLLQNYEKFVKVGGTASICCASLKVKTMKGIDYTQMENGEYVKCREISRVTYATVGTVKKYAEELKRLGVKKAIVDEAHLGSKAGSQIRDVFKKVGITHVVGLTATALYLEGGMNGASLKMMNRARWKMFSDIRHVTQISHLVERKYWSKLLYQVNDTDETYLKENSNGSDFTVQSQRDYYKANNLEYQIVEEIENLLKEGRKSIIVYMPSIEEAEKMFSIFPNSIIVHSKMKPSERNYAIKAFKELTVPVIFNVSILSVGFDHPLLDAIIMARPTSSIALYYQKCIDKNTEILTKRGFVKSEKITKKDIPYGYDMTTGEIRENVLLDIVKRKQYDFEKILSFSSNKIDFRVSSEHDMIFKSRKADKYKKSEAKEILNFKSGVHVPVSGIQKSHGVPLTDDELELLGWLLSDGNINKKNKILTISQSSGSPYIKELEQCIKNCGFKITRDIIKRSNIKYKEGYNYRIPYNSKINKNWKYLEKYYDKNISGHLDNITKRQLKIVMEAVIKGDGANKGKKDYSVSSHIIYMGNNKTYSDRLQSLLVRKGFYCKLTNYTETNTSPEWGRVGRKSNLIKLTFKDTDKCFIAGYNDKDSTILDKPAYTRSRVIQEKTVNENLWCITTEMGTIITRRNGKVMIMGNCGRGVRIHPDKENCKVVDFSGNVKRFGRVEGLHYENVPYYGWGLFNEKNQLLTDFPIKAVNRPTKKTLIEAGKKEVREKETKKNPEFNFGMFKGRKIWDIAQSKDSGRLKSYCSWLYDKYKKGEWTFYGAAGEALKQGLIEYLKIPHQTTNTNGLPF